MRKHAAEQEMGQAHVELRRARLLTALARPLQTVEQSAAPLATEQVEFLRREAEELYWNELAWEELTDEEAVSGGHLTELVFPGFLAFVEGLLLEHAKADSPVPARPHPDVVEDLLLFLGEQYARFTAQLESGADSGRVVWARAMTARLVDLVLYRLYRLTPEEREEMEAVE